MKGEKMNSFEKSVEISEAWDKRHKDPSKNYGIHGVSLKFLLKGPKGVIQFVIYTRWHLPHVKDELLNKCQGSQGKYGRYCSMEPMPADIGYHSLVPQYEGQSKMTDKCDYLDGKPCYYDGSGSNARNVFDRMVKEGHEGMWREMESYYHSWLEREAEENEQ